MSIRFRRSMKIAPGLRLNFSKSTLGLSFGIPGARVSVNTKGDVYTSAGIPGTGLYSVERTSLKGRKGRKRKHQAGELVEQIPAPGFFSPREKKALYRALKAGNADAIFEVGEDFPHIKYVTEALIFPRLLMNNTTDIDALTKRVTEIWNRRSDLEKNELFLEYAKGFEITLKVAPGVEIPMQYGFDALGLAYVEVLQLAGRFEEALAVAESLSPNQATALAVCESELQLRRWKEVLETTEEIENVDDATALLLIYRAISLREQGLYDAAIETLRRARSSKKRNEDVLNKALYERALCYEKLGKKAMARKDLEKIVATDSDFPGVTEALGRL
jgi:tetratricopeptide (TPR) repeat protein